MRTLPLTLLMREGPSARAYLSRLRQADLRPASIILMVYVNRPDTNRPVGRWFPKGIRLWYAEHLQEASLNYWPRQLKKSNQHLFESMVASLEKITNKPRDILNEIGGKFRYEDYSDDVSKVLVTGLGDRSLCKAIKEKSETVILFSGGGIVPTSLLSIPDTKFLHVHPGHLPDVRGADGVLWSILTRGHPSASCFFMAPGIDTGPVIDVCDFPAITVDISAEPRPDDLTLYRALFSYFDPLLRAETLLKVLSEYEDLDSAPIWKQDESAGITYHFMHRSVKTEALKRLFVSRQT